MMTPETKAKCAVCGETRFHYWQTITEMCNVAEFDETGAAVVSDEKFEVTDCTDSGMQCVNGHVVKCEPDNGSESQWSGDVV